MASHLSAFAQGDAIRRYDASSENSVKFSLGQTKQPIFPSRLRHEGYTEGYVVFAILIDHNGQLIDHLLLEASQMQFAESVERVLPEWDYSVPQVDGEPSTIVSSVRVRFERNGAVVTEAIGMYMANQFSRSIGDSIEYRIHSTDELDSLPTPIKIVKPGFHVELLEERNAIEAIFEFYIDTEGNVRMPILREADDKVDERLLVIAQDSLLQWKFNTPTIKNRPVVTRAAQLFRFRRGSLAE